MRTNQAAHDDKAPLGVVDGLLEEMCLDRGDTGGKVIFAGLDRHANTSSDRTRSSRRRSGSCGSFCAALRWIEDLCHSSVSR